MKKLINRRGSKKVTSFFKNCAASAGKRKSTESVITKTAFKNQAYVSRHSEVFKSDRYYTDDGAGYIRNVYYNPDSNAGGQLVTNYLYLDDLKEALDEFGSDETVEKFWSRLDEAARQYLTDIDTDLFEGEARSFVEDPYNFSGRDCSAMREIRNWVELNKT